MTDEEFQSLARGFERPGSPFNTYKGWKFFYDHPGYFAYHHDTIPYSVYFTPDFDEAGELSIQIQGESGVVDGASVPFLTGNAQDLYGIMKQWLEYVEQRVMARGVLEWRPDQKSWKPRP